MFDKIKELASEHGIGVAVGAGVVGTAWAIKSYFNRKKNFDNCPAVSDKPTATPTETTK